MKCTVHLRKLSSTQKWKRWHLKQWALKTVGAKSPPVADVDIPPHVTQGQCALGPHGAFGYAWAAPGAPERGVPLGRVVSKWRRLRQAPPGVLFQ